ncbi:MULTISPECIES: ATP-binding protein [unclassified Streptomyces]|uniref:ATP-binding protein n=1 Tax=unclassified Streptomyces TaxID=2593676 RepID=UPI0019056971|nr:MULTISPECIES: AAA family ATPase [unclassified Streptomyces]MCU4749720.1 AAA family ATPase [Streptomyces sp. G-5]QQN76033.1 AAA family ATPase [Streptomyces sp. XC 2026]
MTQVHEESGTLTGLPRWETEFFGRSAERAALRAALASSRLVTLTGPTGVGKTRLAAAVASRAIREFPAGGGFVELAPGREDAVAQAVAAALGVRERPGQPLEQTLQERLVRGRCLLVVDGCEQAPGMIGGLLARLLDGCPELAVLTTGRRPLGMAGEYVVDLEPLPVAPESASGAVALFLDRARDRGHGRPHAERVCSQWDGVPLAVELAATWERAPAPPPNGRHPHGGTARRAVEWSYGLLDADERRLLRHLGVFLRDFDAPSAHAVAGTARPEAILDRLTTRALLHRRRGPHTAVWRLPAAVRAVALERLDAEGETARCRARHRAWATATARRLERTVAATDGARRPDPSWQPCFDRLADDLRAALDGAGEHPEAAPDRLARALAHLCYARQFLAEARAHFETAAALTGDPSRKAADLRAAADVAMAEHRGDLALPLLRAAAAAAAVAGDTAARATALSFAACIGSRFPATFPDPLSHEEVRGMLEEARRVAPPDNRLVTAYLAAAEAWNATGQKTAPDARLAQRALDTARAAADPVLIAGAVDAVCSGHGAAGRFRAAHSLSDERLRLFDRLPRHDPRIGLEIIDTLHVVPLVAVAAGDLPRAVTAARRAWEDPLSGLYMRASKSVVPLVLSGRFEEALEYAALMWEGWERAGRPAARWMAPAAHAAALAEGLRDSGGREYRRWREQARALAAPWDPHGIAASFAAFADIRVGLHTGRAGDSPTPAVDLAEMLPWSRTPHQFYDAYAWAVAAEAAVVAGLPDARRRLAAAAPAGAENAWAAACLARAAGRLDGDPDALHASLAGWERIGATFERACTLTLLPDREAEGITQLTSVGCRPPFR